MKKSHDITEDDKRLLIHGYRYPYEITIIFIIIYHYYLFVPLDHVLYHNDESIMDSKYINNNNKNVNSFLL